MRNIYIIFLLSISLSSCKDYLDLIPDDIATIDHAFTLRETAEQYLFTCYSYIPNHSSISSNIGFTAGGEIIPTLLNNETGTNLMEGFQTATNPLFDYYGFYYLALRDCNIFLENVQRIPDIEEDERNQWIAEVKVLKAYYHFLLLRMYGPIPVIRDNLPISSDTEATKRLREPVDDVVEYITELIDESKTDLPTVINDPVTQLGRITQQVAVTIKANSLILAASPLFNGNDNYINFVNSDGTNLVSQTYSNEKWQVAAQACKEAIDLCHEAGMELYYFTNQNNLGTAVLSDLTLTKMSIRGSVTEEWNSEIIWGNSNSRLNQIVVTPRSWDPNASGAFLTGRYATPIQTVEMFYSKNGVPISQDKEYPYIDRYETTVAGEDQKYNIEIGYETAELHLNREPRFYATVGVDGGLWFGQGNFDDNSTNFSIKPKVGQHTAKSNATNFSISGYFVKKLVNFENVIRTTGYSQQSYAWPVHRLADLYLLYAEALNEANGPNAETYEYVNRVRKRAGLETVQSSWDNFSRTPAQYTTKEGLRDIIHQERRIELCFEAKSYWDIRRWRTAHLELNTAMEGWNIGEREPENFFQKQVLYEPIFRERDYLWPISENTILKNDKLVQNPEW